MPNSIEKKLKTLGLELPDAAAPVAMYTSYTLVNDLIFISGQLPVRNGEIQFVGKIGENLSIEDGQMAAQLCMLNIIAQLKRALNGNLSQIKRCIRLGGFINSTYDLTEHSKIINGASNLIIQLWGEQGQHTRTTIGVSSLPLGASVEIEAIFEKKMI